MVESRWNGSRLRGLREQAGLTQSELAERAGFTRDGIAKWESGSREPSWSNVLALAQALGVDCTAFTQPPTTEQKAPRPGRPRKNAHEPAEGTEEQNPAASQETEQTP